MSMSNRRAILVCALLAIFGTFTTFESPAQGCPGGNPCGGGDPASQPNSSPATGAGNPIDVTSGNKYAREVDFQYPGELALAFTRHYNSGSSAGGALGGGWSHAFETSLVRQQHGDEVTLQIAQADGRLVQFKANGPMRNGTRRFTSTPSALGVIEEQSELIARIQAGGMTPALSHSQPWVWTWSSGRRVTFDLRGIVKRIEDPDGEHLALEHDGAGRLVRITDARGRYAVISYWETRVDQLMDYGVAPDAQRPRGEPNRVKNIKLFDGRSFNYLYDRNGLLAEVRDASGSLRRYDYALAGGGLLLSKRWGRNDTLLGEYAYDTSGRAIFSSQGVGGHVARLEYRASARAPNVTETVLTNANGERTVYAWRMHGNKPLLLDAAGPGCTSCAAANVGYDYDTEGRVVAIRSAAADAQTIEYDAIGRVAARYEIAGGQRTLIERYRYASDDPIAKPARIERPSVWSGQSHTYDIEYNDRGQPTSLIESGFAPLTSQGAFANISRTTTYTYYERDNGPARLVGKLRSVDGPLPGAADAIRYEYGSRGELRKIIHAGLVSETFEYDQAMRLVAYTPLDGVRVQLTHDREGQLDTITRGGLTTELDYDDQGRVNTIRDPIGQKLTLGYDAASRVTSLADIANNKIVLELDAEGRPVARRLLNPDGSISQEMQSTPEDIARATPARAPWSPAVLSLIRLPGMNPWATQADALIAAADPEFAKESFRRHVMDERGLRSDYVYDDFGRLAYAFNPDSGVIRFEYDEADRMLARHFADERGVRYEYDAIGRPIRLEAAGEITTIEYGLHGKPARISYAAGEERFEYDTHARLVSRAQLIDGKSFVTRYRYDELGRLSEQEAPDGQTLVYRYNASLHAKPGVLASIERKNLFGSTTLISGLNDEQDRFDLQTSRFGNGLEFTRQLDRQGRPVKYGTNAVAEYEFETDEVGRITLARGAPHQGFRYDDAGRLTGAAIVSAGGGVSKLGFAFDAANNLKVAQSTADDVRFRIDAGSNRILSRIRGDGTEVAHSYDAAGRTTSIGSRRFEYDGHGRLAKILEQGKPIAEYAYNAFGERIRKIAYSGNQKTITYFFYDGSKLTAEADQSGTITKHFVYANERAVAAIVDGDVLAVHTDWRGTPVALTNEDQRVVWKATADVLGRVEVQRAAFELNLRGSNQYYDKESGLHYNTHRYFDPESSRYLTPDPIGQQGGLNLYAFVGGDPANQVDLLGMQSTDVRNMSFGDKLSEVFRHTVHFVGADMRASLQSAFDNLLANVATTAAIFAVWAVLQATPIGWLVDAALIGLAYYEFGRAGIDIIRGLVAAFNAMNSATCSADLERAGRELANVFNTAARVIGDRVNFGGRITSIFNRAAPGARNVRVNPNQSSIAPPSPRQINTTGWRRSVWNNLDRFGRGLRGELEVADVLLSRGYRPVGNTRDPRTIQSQADFDRALDAYRGQNGIDMIYSRVNPSTGRTEFIILESKALSKNSVSRSDMDTTNDGRQMSRDWILARLDELVPDPATRAAIERGLRSSDGSVIRVLANTNENGTRFRTINDAPGSTTEVEVGGYFSPTGP